MADSNQVKTECPFCKQAVLNQTFLDSVELNNPNSFNDWKVTIIFYCGLHYMKSYAKTQGVELFSHEDFNKKTISLGKGLSPEFIIDGSVRKDYLNLRQLSYHTRYDGYFSDKINKIILNGRLKDSKEYLDRIKTWIIPKLENENVEVNYSL